MTHLHQDVRLVVDIYLFLDSSKFEVINRYRYTCRIPMNNFAGVSVVSFCLY